MPTRQTLPTMWLMSDRRLGDALWQAIERVPPGGGVVLRHHGSDPDFARTVARLCAARRLMLAVAGDVALARKVGAAMIHNPLGEAAGLLVSRSIHSLAEADAAQGADLVFVSPLFATASHPGAEALGLERALVLARRAGAPAIALGGMNARRGSEAIAAGFHGWAAVGAWLDAATIPMVRA